MDIIAAWTATVEAFNKVFTWKTGGRTKDENSLRAQSEQANDQFQASADSGNVDQLNTGYADLKRVRDEAIAKQP